MGLLQNGYRHNLIGRIVGATNVDGWNPYAGIYNTHRSAAGRNQLAGPAITDSHASVPDGNRHPVAWIMPRKPGGLASRNDAVITITGSGSGAMGVAATGSATVDLSIVGTGGLISSASGTAEITFSADGLLFASKAVAGEATVSFDGAGIVIALGHVGGAAGTVLSATWTPYAVGWVEGTTEESGLTPSGIAQAVWNNVIESGYTAEQILRLIAAFAAGNASGLEGANPQFTGLDGATVRIDGSYSAGNRTIDALNAE